MRVQIDQVESVEEGTVVVAVVANEIERRHAVVVASNRLPIDDARARAQAGQRLHDQWEAAGEVIAGTAVEPHPLTILAGDDSESIVLNLMQPQAAGRQRVDFGGEARRDEAGRKSTRTGKHDVGIKATVAATGRPSGMAALAQPPTLKARLIAAYEPAAIRGRASEMRLA